MQYIELSEKDKGDYNRFVLEQRGSFLQSWGWGEWQKNLGRDVRRFFITNNVDKEAVGAAQFIKMPLPFGRCYWYCPYGPIAASGQNFQFSIFNSQLKHFFSDAVFVKIEPIGQFSILHSPFSIHSTHIQPQRTLVIDLGKTENEILSDMHPKTRYNIRLAEKHKVVVEKDLVVTPGRGLYHKEFLDLLSETEDRQGFLGHGREYYEKMIDFFALKNPGDIQISLYKAVKDRELLACALVLDCGQTRTYLFGGSSEKNKNLMAPYAMHFQAIADGKVLGLTSYDFWGLETSSGKEPGFSRFKKGFGGRVLDYPGAVDFVIQPWEYKMYKGLKALKNIFR